jgi:glyoxylase-like metal-dependent hydrolase (beta-lactamase superfamily II)
MAKTNSGGQVAEGCYMIGHRNPDSLLQCNTYLRTFDGAKTGKLNWCVDPGSVIDLPVVRSNLLDIIGDFAALDFISMNHQDPDVTGNLIYFVQQNPNLKGLITEDAWRLVRHLNAHPKELWFANKRENRLLHLPGEHRLQMVPTPFCHFRGAMAFYDPESQILFSGDLFGGLNALGRIHLVGQKEDWPGIAQFHQIYMPSRQVVAYALKRIRALEPRVKIIAPQHGFVLTGDFMHEVMDRLEELPMGMDLFPEEHEPEYDKEYAEVFRDILKEVEGLVGASRLRAILEHLPANNELAQYIRISASDITLIKNGVRALPLLVDVLTRHHLPAYRSQFKDRVLRSCLARGIPLPQMGVGVEEPGAEVGGYWFG